MNLFNRLLLFMITTGLSPAASSQEAEVVVPVGHNARINIICFSHDHKQIATGSGEMNDEDLTIGNIIKLWDLFSGNELLSLKGYDQPVTAMAFSANDALLAGGTSGGQVIIWDLATETVFQRIHCASALKAIFFTSHDQYLITVTDKVTIWDVRSGSELKQAVTGVIKFNAAAADSTHNRMAIAEKSRNISFYGSVGLIKKLETFTGACRQLAFNGMDQLICLGNDISLNGESSNRLKWIDVISGITLQSLPVPVLPENGLTAIAEGGQYFAVEEPQSIVIRNTENGSLIRKIAKSQLRAGEPLLTFMRFSPDRRSIAIAITDKNTDEQEVHLFTIEANDPARVLRSHSRTPVNALFCNNDELIDIAYGEHSESTGLLWNLKKGNLSRNVPSKPMPVRSFARSGSIELSMAGSYLMERTGTGEAAGIRIIQLKSEKILGTINEHSRLVFSDNDLFITGKSNTDGTTLTLWRSNDLRLLRSFRHTATVWDFAFANGGKKLITACADKTARVWDTDKATVIKTFRGHEQPVNRIAISADEKLLATGDFGGVIKVWDLESEKCLYTLKGHTEKINSLQFSRNKELLVSCSEDHTIRLWNLQKEEELVAAYAIDSADFMVCNKDGYYMATPGGVKKLYFKVGERFFSFEQFDLQFNRPDKVLSSLNKAPEELLNSFRRIYEKRLRKMNFNPANFEKERSFNVPQLQVTQRLSIPHTTTNRTMTFTVEVKDAHYRLDRLNVYVNGVPIYGIKGLSVKQKNVHELKQEVSIRLSAGRNNIEASALNEKGVESLKEQFAIEYKGSADKPDLYLVTIGVNKYLNNAMNLRYASKDADDINDLFRNQTGHFKKIHPVSLNDEKATRENILAVKTALKNSREDDYVIIFYAGHGLLDDSLDYYLSTYDMDFSIPVKKGLLYSDLESLLDEIPARDKLLLLDACHSGEIDKEDIKLSLPARTEEGAVAFRTGEKRIQPIQTRLKNSIELMKELFIDLRRSTGTTVISSAGGMEYALEGDIWKNGVFTSCILAGLKDNKADFNHDGRIMVSELQRYVFEKVPLLTNGLQTPTSRIENLVNDLQLW